VTNAATSEDVQTTSGLVITRNPADGVEVTHFKITTITGGTLFQNDGTTVISDGDFITFAQANAGLKFTPSLNSIITGHFTMQASTSNVDGGLGGSTVTADITVSTVADTPSVTNATTLANTQSTSGLVISRNAADGIEVTHFKVTNITGGSLFQNDGTTAINNGDFITFEQANAGLKFTPQVNSLGTGHFTIQASLNSSDAGLGGNTAVADITVTPAPIGTSADDVFVLTYSGAAPGGTVSVTISSNGGPAVAFGTFPMNFPLTIDGLGGNDSIRVAGTSDADTFTINTSSELTINGASLILTSIENRTLSGAAGSDVYKFDADKALGLWVLDETDGGTDTVDFSLTTTVGLSLNMATAEIQAIHATNLSLVLGSDVTMENAIGGSGADTLSGNSLSNTLAGGAGNDILIGAAGNDLLFGGANDDTYIFATSSGTEADQVTENLNEGIDTLSFAFLTTDIVLNLGTTSIQPVHADRTMKLNSALVFENIIGGTGADTLFGNSRNNMLSGGAGNDKLIGGAGNDSLFGGANNDTYVFVPSSGPEADQVNENQNDGIDTLSFAFLTTDILLNLGSSFVQSVHTGRTLKLNSAVVFENIIGGTGADTLFGNSLNNTLSGGIGDDKLLGAGGNDLLIGGANNDTYIFVPSFGPEADQITERIGEGIDTVSFVYLTTDIVLNLGSSFVQPVHTDRTLKLNSAVVFENLIGGTGADTLFGNSLNNTLAGGAGDDKLIGAAGNDLLIGGANNDAYIFVTASGPEADQVTENINEGTDTLSFAFLTTDVVLNLGSSFVQPVHTNRTLKLNSAVVFENLVGGTGADTLFGNRLDNTLTGGAGNDKLIGAAGNDLLIGGANNDTYFFVATIAAEADQVTERVNEGIDTLNFGYLTTSVVLNLGSTSIQTVNLNRTLKLSSLSAFENAVGGTGSDTLLGNTVANRLTGGEGDDILVGLQAGDILEAGSGRDILIGGQGLDILKGDAGEDILIAGRTTSDTSLSNLNTLRTQWISASAYAARITNLRAGVGSPAVSLKAKINVLNDAGEDDVLVGGTDTDWFFRAVDDVIADLFAGELIDVL
jgi:Ca2+-binding RTX toxin-like protein